MIVSFRHKGLKRFFETRDARGINAEYAARVRTILTVLDTARGLEQLTLPTYRLHELAGDLRGFYAVTVRANWRIIFRYHDGDAFDVDLVDYH